jgi:prophage regulatory protein
MRHLGHTFNQEDIEMSTQTKLVSQAELRNRVPYSRSHIDRLERSGNFPRRLKIGPQRIAWLSAEIDQWIEERAKERDNNAE